MVWNGQQFIKGFKVEIEKFLEMNEDHNTHIKAHGMTQQK